MPKQGWLTKTLAIAGTFLAWLPILTLVIITGAMLIQRGEFHFDYLIPAELFPVFLGGGLLLLWASIRVKRYRMWIGVGLGAAVFFLVAGQAGIWRDQTWKLAVERGAWIDLPL
jgi:peptidoglycan/LPS O-acetylase OafA/YrhL